MAKPRPATLEPDPQYDGMITGGGDSEAALRELYALRARTAPRLDLRFSLDKADVAFGAPTGAPTASPSARKCRAISA